MLSTQLGSTGAVSKQKNGVIRSAQNSVKTADISGWIASEQLYLFTTVRFKLIASMSHTCRLLCIRAQWAAQAKSA